MGGHESEVELVLELMRTGRPVDVAAAIILIEIKVQEKGHDRA